MAFDFPANPVENQEFTPAGGPTYIYKAPRWLALNFTQGTVPEAPNTGAKYARQSLAWYDLATDFSAKVAKAGDTMSGPLAIDVASPYLLLQKSASGQSAFIRSRTGANSRWTLYLGDITPEPGSGNAGSDFVITRHTDAGAGNGNALVIPRATGIVDMPLGATTLTPPVGDNDTSVATTQFVTRANGLTPVVPKVDASGNVDWNTITTAGWHGTLIAGHATSATNAPPIPTVGYFYCQVLLYASTNITQIAYPYSDPAHPAFNSGFWYRGRMSGVWSAWKQLAPATAEARNRIVNPAMQISQQWGDTAVGAFGYYPVDQWVIGGATTTGVAQWARVQLATPNKSPNRIRATITVADASITAAEYSSIRQTIEGINVANFGWGAAGARQVILRFGWKSPAGTYSFRLTNGAGSRTYIANFTIAAGQANTDTEQVFVVPGDTTGVWDTDTAIGLYLDVVLACGPSLQGVAGWQAGALLATAANSNGLATLNAVFELFDVGLYLDPDKTGLAPPWQMPDEAEELLACMRYWQQLSFYFSGNVTSGLNYISGADYRVPPRPGAAHSGVNTLNGSFPATVGGLTPRTSHVQETRTANATATGNFGSVITVNGRM